MKRLITWTILVAMLGSAWAVGSTPTKPFIRISTSPDELDLGTATFYEGVHVVQNALKVNVEANCWHGPILMSTTPLERVGGGRIKPDNIFVKAAGKGAYVSLEKPVVIVPTAMGSQQVVLDFKVQAGLNNPSGEYKGMITLTIVPPV